MQIKILFQVSQYTEKKKKNITQQKYIGYTRKKAATHDICGKVWLILVVVVSFFSIFFSLKQGSFNFSFSSLLLLFISSCINEKKIYCLCGEKKREREYSFIHSFFHIFKVTLREK